MNRHMRRAMGIKGPVRLESMQFGVFEKGTPSLVRLSTILRELRARGSEDAANQLESDAKTAAAFCGNCERPMTDPVVGLLRVRGKARVAFCCPHCSGDEVFKRWESEGANKS